MTDQGRQDPQARSGRDAESSDTPTSSTQRGRSRARAQGGRQPSSPRSRQFLFIDASTDRGTSGEAIRVHAMREAHRTRRERAGSQSQSRRAAAQDEIIILDLRSASRPPSQTPPSTAAADEQSAILADPGLAIDWSAATSVAAAAFTSDSFQALERLAEELRNFQPVRPDVLYLCQGDFLSLCSYLALAASQLASSEQDQANVASAQFEARALELLRLRITQASRLHNDHTLVAVLLLSYLEEHKQNSEASLFHRNALQRLIRDRGGLQGIVVDNAELANLLSQAGFLDEIA